MGRLDARYVAWQAARQVVRRAKQATRIGARQSLQAKQIVWPRSSTQY